MGEYAIIARKLQLVQEEVQEEVPPMYCPRAPYTDALSLFCAKGGIIIGMERRDKKNYYLDLAEVVSQRSTCLRRHYV